MHHADQTSPQGWIQIALLGCSLSFPTHTLSVHAQTPENLSMFLSSSKTNSQASTNMAPLGTPITWLQGYGYTNNYAAAELEDLDGDRQLNWKEYVAGTNPKQSNSVFRISDLSVSTSGGVLSFTTQSNRTYRVDYSDSMKGWRPLQEGIQGDGKAKTITDVSLASSRYYRVAVTNSGDPFASITNSMVWIKPGTFIMGSPITEKDRNFSETQHHTTLSQGFWMKKHEVTQEEFIAVMGFNPSSFSGNTNLPVEMVSWVDATNYCHLLTEQERKAGRLPRGYSFALPTEAQWEYACRAGTTNATSYGTNLSATAANFDGKSPYNGGAIGVFLGRTTPVGSYAANAWGLFDMHGNAMEWCIDWYGAYPSADVTDPAGPISGSERVLRGGNWFSFGRICRSAYRGSNSPTTRNNTIGFRTVLVQIR